MARQTDTKTQTARNTDRQTHTQRGRERDKQTGECIEGLTDRLTGE